MPRRDTPWSTWLQDQLDQRQLRQIDLAKRSGGTINRDRVSKWLKGEYNAEPDVAIQVAQLLGADPVDALRAAGHPHFADLFAKRRPEAAWQPEELDFMNALEAMGLPREEVEQVVLNWREARRRTSEDHLRMARIIANRHGHDAT